MRRSAGQRQRDAEAQDHHEGEDVPVADGAAEPGPRVRVRHDIRHRLAEEGVDPHRRRHHDVTVAGRQQLQAAHRRQAEHCQNGEVERRQVEGDPGEIRAEGPQHGDAAPHGEGGEDAESDEEESGRAGAPAQEPDPDRGGDEDRDGDHRDAPHDVAAGEKREGRHGGHRDRVGDRVPGPERRPHNAGGVCGRSPSTGLYWHRRMTRVPPAGFILLPMRYGHLRGQVVEVNLIPGTRREDVVRGGEDMRGKLLGAITVALLLILVFAVVAQAAVVAVHHRRDHQGRPGRDDRWQLDGGPDRGRPGVSAGQPDLRSVFRPRGSPRGLLGELAGSR